MIKILLIEDQEDIRSIIREILTAENFFVTEAENGQAGIKLLQTEIPDLIICDIAMPKLNGYEVVTWARENPTTEAIPFIFLTAKGSQNNIRQAIELGGDDYLVKPFTRAELLGAITARLDKQQIINRQIQKQIRKINSSLYPLIGDELINPVHYIMSIARKLIDDYEFMDKDEILINIKEIYDFSKKINDKNSC